MDSRKYQKDLLFQTHQFTFSGTPCLVLTPLADLFSTPRIPATPQAIFQSFYLLLPPPPHPTLLPPVSVPGTSGRWFSTRSSASKADQGEPRPPTGKPDHCFLAASTSATKEVLFPNYLTWMLPLRSEAHSTPLPGSCNRPRVRAETPLLSQQPSHDTPKRYNYLSHAVLYTPITAKTTVYPRPLPFY